MLCEMSKLTFTLIQTNLLWEDKAANLQMLEQKIASVAGASQVVILPEMFTTGFSMQPEKWAEDLNGNTITWLKQLAAKHKLIITGSLILKEEAGGVPMYFNRLIWALPNGTLGQYNKRHLFAYAGEDEHYTAGTKRLIASVNGWKINLMICYDLRFPVWSRQQPKAANSFEYDVLIYVANWPEKRSLAWKTLLQARAIENQCYVIGVNRVGADGNNINHSGNSMVIDPLGEVLYHKANEEDAFTITFDKTHLDQVRAQFPFWRDADTFKIEA